MLRGAMSKLGDALTLRPAQQSEHAKLEELQRRASLELPEYRDQLLAHPDAIHLPPAQIANGQVIVAQIDDHIVGFAAVVGGELDGLFVEPDLWGQGIGSDLVDAATHEARRKGSSRTPERGDFTRAADFRSRGRSRRASGPALRMSK